MSLPAINIATLPTVLVYLFIQKHFDKGLTIGAVTRMMPIIVMLTAVSLFALTAAGCTRVGSGSSDTAAGSTSGIEQK